MNIVVVVAHPDDETLGCGGTIAKLVSQEHKVYVLALADGVTSRDPNADKDKRWAGFIAASKVLGFRPLAGGFYRDQRLDSYDFLNIAEVVAAHVRALKPERIFTHFKDDLNLDHRIICQAAMTASRAYASTVKDIWMFEVPGSTECGLSPFAPNLYVDISDGIDGVSYMEMKCRALNCYQDELRPFPHPRSIEGIGILAGYRGMAAGVKAAEAFQIVRMIR